MSAFPITDILGLPLHMTTLEQAASQAESWVRAGERHYVCHVTVHSLIESQDDEAVHAALSGAGLTATDGVPLVWLGRHRGFDCGRVYGPDLMTLLCRRTASWADRSCRHFLYGSTPEVLERLAAELRRMAPGIVIAGQLSPPMGPMSPEIEAEHRKIIDDCGANIVWVGLGAPKQELWMARNRPFLAAELLVGVGAAFDFLSGAKRQAPPWMQRSGLEWAFRLLTEPRRLARRYIVTNSRFLALLALSRRR